jgi:hypothetical protein
MHFHRAAKADFPGAAQHASDALQTRDRLKRGVCNGPGSAVQRFALRRIREKRLVSAPRPNSSAIAGY